MNKFFQWLWPSLNNMLAFVALHCLTCQRFYDDGLALSGRPICFLHTVYFQRLVQYNNEGKLWSPDEGDYQPPECGVRMEK